MDGRFDFLFINKYLLQSTLWVENDVIHEDKF